jgi:hypothetical protein
MSFEVTFTLQDAYSRRTTRRMTNTRADIADAQTDVTAMIATLEALSNAAVVKTAIAVVATYATSPEEYANLDAGATLHGRLNNGKLYPIHIPAIEVAKVNEDGSLDLADEDIVELETAMGSAGHWQISEGNTIANFESGELDL